MRTLFIRELPQEELAFLEEVRAATPHRALYQEQSLLPRTVLGWLPFLWQRVLFPGRAEAAGAWTWGPLLLLLILPGLLLYPSLSFHLLEPDEGRYAQIPREMLTANEWIVPTLQNEPYLDKPPLFYWLVMGSFSLFGYHTWAARLVPALAVHATIFLTYFLGRRLFSARSAFWGALLLSLAPAFVGMGRLLVLDGLLALWVTLALFSAYRAVSGTRLAWSWWLTAAAATGLGILTKGPVALILLLPPLVAHRWLTTCPARIGARGWALFLGVAATIALPWYVAVCVSRPEFARYFLWEHNVLRFFQPFDHIRPVGFYVPIMLLGLLPGMLWLPSLVRYLLSSDEDATRRRSPAFGFCLLAGCWCLVFFSLSGSKLPTYILPAFPFLALALAHALVERGWTRGRSANFLVGAFTALLFLGQYVFLPWYTEEKAPLSDVLHIDALCTPETPIFCFPRSVDSVAFHLGRSDFKTFRGKDVNLLVDELQKHPRAVVLFAHRNSPETLRRNLPPELRLVQTDPLGLCQMGVIESNTSPRR